jgi:hypothetical protein
MKSAELICVGPFTRSSPGGVTSDQRAPPSTLRSTDCDASCSALPTVAIQAV